jgi:hypothetical protein
MKKLTVILIFTVIVAATAIYFVAQNRSDSTSISKESKVEISTGEDKTSIDLHEKERLNPEPILSPEQIESFELKRDNIGEKLSALADELDRNLNNEKEKYRIKQEYQVLTKEYNQIAIQLFKAGNESSVAGQL